jgi:hypothetical protein
VVAPGRLDQQLSATAIVLVGWPLGCTPAQAESSTKAARKARVLVIYPSRPRAMTLNHRGAGTIATNEKFVCRLRLSAADHEALWAGARGRIWFQIGGS